MSYENEFHLCVFTFWKVTAINIVISSVVYIVFLWHRADLIIPLTKGREGGDCEADWSWLEKQFTLQFAPLNNTTAGRGWLASPRQSPGTLKPWWVSLQVSLRVSAQCSRWLQAGKLFAIHVGWFGLWRISTVWE